MTPANTATSPSCACGSARSVSSSLGTVWAPEAVTPSMAGSCPGRHLDADAGQEPDQDGAEKEIGQETEPRRPGRQQHPPGQQGGQPGQPDVLLRSRRREAGERRGEDGGGRGIRGDDQVAG